MLVAAYIILGFAFIGQEIENPFGHDVNDLPLDNFCNQLVADIDIIASFAPQKADTFVKSKQNRIMYPLSCDSYEVWKDRSLEEIREALRRKTLVSMKNAKPRPRCCNNTDKDNGQY